MSLRRSVCRSLRKVDEAMELQNKLLHLVRAKVSVIQCDCVDQSKQIKEHDEKAKTPTAELNSQKKKAGELQKELSKRLKMCPGEKICLKRFKC